MITLNELLKIANEEFSNGYKISTLSESYLHSTMGRKDDKSRDVKELLILAKKNRD